MCKTYLDQMIHFHIFQGRIDRHFILFGFVQKLSKTLLPRINWWLIHRRKNPPYRKNKWLILVTYVVTYRLIIFKKYLFLELLISKFVRKFYMTQYTIVLKNLSISSMKWLKKVTFWKLLTCTKRKNCVIKYATDKDTVKLI